MAEDATVLCPVLWPLPSPLELNIAPSHPVPITDWGAAREWLFLASSNRRLIFSGRMAGNIDRSSEFPPCCQNIGLCPSSTFLCLCVNIFAELKLCHTRNSIFHFLLSQGCIGTAHNNSIKTIWKTNLIHFFKKRETNIFI